MQKSTKRLLSLLVVLALVLTIAPAGILAVETKANETEPTVTPGQASLPAGVQDKIDAAAAVKTWADGIKEAIKTLTGDTGTDKVNQVAAAKSCPACGRTDITWTRASGWNVPTNGANEADRRYYHLVVDRNMTAGVDFVNLPAYATVCVLWVGDYTVTCTDNLTSDATGADVKLNGYQGVLNIMGSAKIASNSTTAPMFNFTNTGGVGTTLNLYGGTYIHNNSAALGRAIIHMNANASHVVNIYNDVVIGPTTFQEPGNGGTIPAGTGYCNVRLGAGTVNMYGGTIQNGYSASSNQGWNVMNIGGTFNMYGGTIKGGSGINGATGTNVHNRKTFNMYGGEIKDGKTFSYQGGGQFYVGTGSVATAAPATVATATLYGGKITGGVNTNPDASMGRGGNVNIAGSHANLDASVGYGKLVIPANSTALIEGGKTGAGGYGGNVMIARGGELDMAGGFIQGGLTEGNNTKFGGNISIATGATANISGGTISGGKAGSNGGNIYAATDSVLEITGGTITKGVSAINGGNIWGAISFTASNATITDGKGANGGNLFVQTGPVTLEATNTIKNGTATDKGGNIFVGTSCVTTIKCDLTGGTAANTGGSICADYSSTVVLDGVTVSGGKATTATLSNNIRINKATLKLVGDTNVASGVLLDKDGPASINVDQTFSGAVALWHTTPAAPGAAVPNSTCNGPFTGTVKNTDWVVASGVYAHLEMMYDGESGLKYPAQGIIDNGTMTPAASSQDAVDAFIAAIEDEEVEVKPQYVYITEDVELTNGAEVAIYAAGEVTVSGDGVVMGVDRANDDFVGHSGSITVTEGVTVAEEVTAGGRRYIALNDVTGNEPNKYTFHRVESVLTNVTINKDNAGLYYKARYQFDEAVKDRVVSYGVLVKLDQNVYEDNYAKMTSSDDTSGYADVTLTAVSHGVYGIFKTGNDASRNLSNGQRKLYGNPYLAINNTNENRAADECPLFDANSTGMSLSDAMVRANECWNDLSAESQGHLNDFVNTWNAKGAWSQDVLAKLVNFDINN